MRLGEATIAQLPQDVVQSTYDRAGQQIGIVHFGIGAFHRAHMAWYTEQVLEAGEWDWLISGVSLRSRDVADRLNPQDCYYTLTERCGSARSTRLIGAVREVLFAPEDRERVVARLAQPSCHIASFTVTEKGYARAEGTRLDFATAEQSFYPLLAEGLDRRRARGLPGITLLPCDNLADNGRVLKDLMEQWLAARSPDLLEWFRSECRVPSTMIDRIVPRSGEDDLSALSRAIGMEDAGAVFTERFSQWVIEDAFAGPRPAWEDHGAQIVADVAPYEAAKLRMLNGAHSLLAYCGLRADHEFVHQAVADPGLTELAIQLMHCEAIATLEPARGQDLEAYSAALLERFSDPALRHRLAQIAMDGTQKIPQRWLDSALHLARRGIAMPAIAAAFDPWLWHIEHEQFLDDPERDVLLRRAAEGGRAAIVDHCFGKMWTGYGELAELFRTDGEAS